MENHIEKRIKQLIAQHGEDLAPLTGEIQRILQKRKKQQTLYLTLVKSGCYTWLLDYRSTHGARYPSPQNTYPEEAVMALLLEKFGLRGRDYVTPFTTLANGVGVDLTSLLIQNHRPALLTGLAPSPRSPAGNHPENLRQGGFAAAYGAFLYFLESGGPGILRLNTQTGELLPISEAAAWLLSVNDYGLFYLNRTEDCICRCDHDGGNPRRLPLRPNGLFYLYEEYLYFVDGEAGFSKYAIPTGAVQLLTRETCKYVNIVDGQIYYQNAGGDGYPYRMNLDGGDKKCLAQEIAAYLTVVDGYLYYGLAEDADFHDADCLSVAIKRMKLDGSGQTTLREGLIRDLHVTQSHIFFDDYEESFDPIYTEATGDHTGILTCLPLHTAAREGPLSPGHYRAYNIAGGYIFYRSDGRYPSIRRESLVLGQG